MDSFKTLSNGEGKTEFAMTKTQPPSSAECQRLFTPKKIIVSICFLVAVFVFLNYRIGNRSQPDIPTRNDVQDTERVRAPALAHNLTNKHVTKTNVVRSSSGPKDILIFGDVSVIKSWFELMPMVHCFTYPDKKEGTRACPVFCPSYDTWINLTIGSKPSQYDGKDAIVFGLSPFTLLRNHDVVVKKQFPPNVLTVFYSMESPLRIHKWIWRIPDGKYHITMSYLTGSNITVPYSYYKAFAEEKVLKPRNYAKGKTKLVAWMGSNCVKEVFWPRMELINRLQAHIPIDTYGKCGNLTCLPRLSDKCVNMLKQYKFYLAFENSECHEYITEKLWVSSLQNDVVPIVYGASRSDYDKFAPPNSYIHVGDFKNLEELARYLKLLDEKDYLYNKYFEWKTKGNIVNVYPKMEPNYFCEIIPFLNQNLERKPLSKSVWANSCRNQIKGRFNPNEQANFDNWSHW